MPARRVTFCLLMLATVVAVLLGGGSSAQASCGDYLIVGQQHPQQAPSNQSHSPPHSKVPGDGPGCQKAPTEPMLPIPVKISQPETQRLGCLFASLKLTSATQTSSEVEHSELPHSGHPNSIEHPPRA